MTSEPLDVSFIIPTHNRVTYLADAVTSVLGQTRPPREVIVVDNGTLKKAGHILARFGDRVTLIHSQEGVVQLARNVGIEAAASTWVALLDDDDLVDPTYLEKAEASMRDPRVDLIGTDHLKFRGDHTDAHSNFEQVPLGYWEAVRERAGSEFPAFVGKFPLANLLTRVPIYPSTTIVRREFALRIGGYSQCVNGIPAEDIEFLVRALNDGNLSLIFEPLVKYRLHDKNNTASLTGQEIGRWRIFEYVRQTHGNLPSDFVAALDADLPDRRIAAFRTAYRTGRRAVMKELFPMLRRRPWSLEFWMRNAISMMPAPIACKLRFGAKADG